MILKAVERGVPEERIAKALNVDVHSIVRKRRLLEGICHEVAEILMATWESCSVMREWCVTSRNIIAIS
jgi:hypothetical protein